jgi:hypothetical protein
VAVAAVVAVGISGSFLKKKLGIFVPSLYWGMLTLTTTGYGDVSGTVG